MYSEKIIIANIAEFARREGWEPEYHSYEEVQQLIEDINKLVKIDYNSRGGVVELTRTITEKYKNEVKRKVVNEQVLCGFDCGYFEANYAFVCDEEGKIFKFRPRLSQQIYNAVVADFDERQVSIELLVLKARQTGITTQTAIKFMHRMLFVKHTQAIMASVKHEHSQHIKRIQDTTYENCPWWLVPGRAPRGGFDNGSILSIQSGMQATGLGQGRTPVLAHVSEIGDVPNQRKSIEEGLMRAMHISSALFLVLEGTGAGNTGWLADKWRAAKTDFPKGDERLCPVFISWPCCPEIYPKPGFIEKFPIPEGFMSKMRVDATRKHVARCEAYIRNTPYLSRIMGHNWTMPPEQQWFWQWNYLQAVKTHSQKTWQSQMPADDFESLVGEHDTVFDPEIMAEVESHVYEIQSDQKIRKTPLKAYAITGDSIEEEFYPSEGQIDDDEPVIRVEWRSHIGKKYVWEMIPLREVNEEKEIDTFDKLLVYEEPTNGFDYSCGIDTAYGLGEEDEDRTVVSIWKNGFGLDTDDQVAELCLAAGTFVTTKEGCKKIEDVGVGETVVDRLGNYTVVNAVTESSHQHSLQLYTGLSSNHPLVLTSDHKVATVSGWKRADELKVGEWLRYPVRPMRDEGLPNATIKNYKRNGDKIRDLDLPLTYDFGFTCGLYLAEGCVALDAKKTRRHVSWTLHEREAGTWKEIIERATKCRVTELQIKGTRAHRLLISSRTVAEWFEAAFGRTNGKHIPSWVWNAPREFAEGLVHGMVAGDGAIDKRCNSVVYVSVIPSLAVGLRDLVLSLGWGLGVLRHYNRPYAQNVWYLYFYGEVAQKFHKGIMIRSLPCQSKKRQPSSFRWGWNKEWIYVRVTDMEPGGDGIFYDLTVDSEDHSFCTMQAAVHNCSNRMNSAQIVGFAACTAAWYSSVCKDWRGVKFAIEQITGPGDTCQNQLKMMGFNYHHRPRRYDSRKVKDESKRKEGWYSTGWSVPMLMTSFINAVNGGLIRPKSKWLIEEMRTLERHITSGGKTKMEHRSGQHDDRVRAAAQAFFTVHDLDDLAERAQQRRAQPARRKVLAGAGVCKSNAVAVSEDDEWQ